MAKKPPPNMDDLVADAKRTQAAIPITSDPKLKKTITVTLDQVIVCPWNPRTQRNPKFDEIKASIRQRGLDHAPNITREHPTDLYMIKDGGNTRLEVLKELWAETKEDRFYRFESTFHPWSSPTELLIGHLVENDLRGDTLFIERAVAAVNLKQMLEVQAGENAEPLSIRQAAERFTELGWIIDPSSLTVLLYAHHQLFPYVPQAFWAGMGRDRVRRLRKIYTAYKKYAASVDLPERELDECWQTALCTNDGDELDFDAVVQETNHALAQQLDTYGHLINGEVNAILRGGTPSGRLSSKADAEARFSARQTEDQPGTREPPSAVTTPGATVETPQATTEEPLAQPSNQQDFYPWIMAQRKIIYEVSQQFLSAINVETRLVDYTPDYYYGYCLNIDRLLQACDLDWGQKTYIILLYQLGGAVHQMDYPQSCETGDPHTEAMALFTGGLDHEALLSRQIFAIRTSPWPDNETMNNLSRELEALITGVRRRTLEHLGHDQYLSDPAVWTSQEAFDARVQTIKSGNVQ